MFEITCASCSVVHRIPLDHAGKVGRCPCGAKVQVPSLFDDGFEVQSESRTPAPAPAPPCHPLAPVVPPAPAALGQPDAEPAPEPASAPAVATPEPTPDAHRSIWSGLMTYLPTRPRRQWIIGGIGGICLVLAAILTLWLRSDPLAGNNIYQDARRWEIAPPSAPAASPANPWWPLIWRIEGPDGRRGHLVATLWVGRTDDVIPDPVRWALADAGALVVEVDAVARPGEAHDWFTAHAANDPKTLHAIFADERLRSLSKALADNRIAWETVRSSQPGPVHSTLLARMAFNSSLFGTSGLERRLLEAAHERRQRIIALASIEERHSGSIRDWRMQAQALTATVDHSAEVPALLEAMHQAWRRGDERWLTSCAFLEQIEPLSLEDRHARCTRIVNGVMESIGDDRRPLVAIGAPMAFGDGNVRSLLAAKGFSILPIESDPFQEFPSATEAILQAPASTLRQEWICDLIKKRPQEVRKPLVAQVLTRWQNERGFEEVRPTLWQALPPYTAADGEVISALHMWLAPGTSAALPSLPLPERRRIANEQLRSDQIQDWGLVISTVAPELSPSEFIETTLHAGTDSAHAALTEHIRSKRLLARWNDLGPLLRYRIDVPSPRQQTLLDLAWEQTDRDALQRDTESLRNAIQTLSGDCLHLMGSAGMPRFNFERNLWGLVSPEVWQKWWEQQSLPRDALIAMAKAGVKGTETDPRSGLGRLTMAALEYAGRDREPVLAKLRATNSEWLLLLRVYVSAATDVQRERAVNLMAGLNPDWRMELTRGFIGNGMIQGDWTKPFALFVQMHPECLATVLAAGPSIVSNGAVSPSREVMMCYELGSDIIPQTMRLAIDASAPETARFNAQILLRVFLQEKPSGIERHQAAIQALLQR